MQKHGRTSNAYYWEKETSLKRPFYCVLYDSNWMTFWKRLNYEDSRKIRNWRGDGCIKRQSTEDFDCSESTLYDAVSSVLSLSHVWLSATPWIAARQASLSITNSRSLLKLMPIELVMPSSHLILCHPLLLLPPTTPSIRVFSNESTLCVRWPKYWSFSFSISPSNEHPGLISFRMDWLDLLAVQGLSRVFSYTTVQKHQFFGAQLSSQSNSHIHTWPLEKPYPWPDGPLLAK